MSTPATGVPRASKGLFRRLIDRVMRRGRSAPRFDSELRSAGQRTAISYEGLRVIETRKIVGTVSRWQNLRSDFFYKHGKKVTSRFVQIGKAMKRGDSLPPIEVYKLKRRPHSGGEPAPPTEYYVLDGHHRVAMAKKLGQEYLDAEVTRYEVTDVPRTHSSRPLP